MSNGWHVGTNNTDPCVFVLLSPENTFSIMWIHTDDCFVRGERDEDLEYIRNSFGNRFGIKRVDPRFMLGLYSNIIDAPDGSKVLEFTQPDFIENMLSEFGMHIPDKEVSTPFKPGAVLGCKEAGYDPPIAEQKAVKERGYMRLVGMLLWCARRCYSECLFGTNQLCAVMSKPSEAAWDHAIRVLNWLKHNYTTGLRFSSSGNQVPKIFYDSSHNQFTSDSKSTYGVAVVLADGPVGAESKRHPDLGDSTPYSEYMALFHASKRAVSTYQFIHELDNVCRSKGVPERFAHMIKEPLIIYGDNDVATGSGLERRTLPRSRHWLLKYHATRDYVRQKLIIPKRVPTHDNISDCLTKALELADWNNVGMRMKGYAPIWPYNRL